MKFNAVSAIESAAVDLFAKQRLASIPEYFSAGYTLHLTAGTLKGHAHISQFLAGIHQAFPKLTIAVEILLQQDDRIAWQRTLKGVQQNALEGFPATGREVVWRDMVVTRFEVELIKEEWVVSDLVERVLRVRKKA